MRRIFLLLDDYVELTFLETILKKVGFDAVGYQGIMNASDKAMEISPDLLILSDVIKGQATSDALDQIKRIRPQAKCLLLRRDFSLPITHNLKLIDLTLKSPIDPIDFLKHVSGLMQVDAAAIVEKFMKLGLFRGAEAESYIKVAKSTSTSNAILDHTDDVKVTSSSTENSNFLKKVTSTDTTRIDSYQKKIQGVPEAKSSGIDHKAVVKASAELRSRSGDKELQKIDEERQEFVKALFKK